MRGWGDVVRRSRYFLIGGIALVISLGLIGWHFWDGRGEVLKPDGGPVVTVMDFSRSFPLDPLPSGWRHRKFWTRSPMTMSFTVKDGVPSMRFETHDSASMLFRSVDIDLAAYPMLAWRWYIESPIRSPLDERTREGDDHPARLFLWFLTDRGGRWLDEKIDLARVYAEIWKDAAPAHLVDVAVFCDSDDTHTASIAYFAYVRLERR